MNPYADSGKLQGKDEQKGYMTLQIQETLVIVLVHLVASEMTNTEQVYDEDDSVGVAFKI